MEIIATVLILSILFIYFLTTSSTNKKEKHNPKYSYFRRENFMTEREKIFFRKLQVVCGDSLVVFSQVRVFLLLNHKVRGQNFRAALSRINQKSVYFLLCDYRSLRPLIAIELDDKTHNLPDRQKRDLEVDIIFDSAKFPLLHIQNVNIENSELKNKILELL